MLGHVLNLLVCCFAQTTAFLIRSAKVLVLLSLAQWSNTTKGLSGPIYVPQIKIGGITIMFWKHAKVVKYV